MEARALTRDGGIAGTAAGLQSVDWSRPWLAPLRQDAPLLHAPDFRAALTQAAAARGVVTARGHALRFVQAQAAGDMPYEAFIAATGQVPTRANLHDAFNALMWLRWPQLKAALNAAQADVLANAGVAPRRGPIRDAATLLDENGLLMVAPPEAVEALAQHDWPRLLVERRGHWGRDIQVIACGHALLEKLVTPYKAITAHVLPLPALTAGTSAAKIDAAAASVIDADLAPARLLPLPVLGVPGWWPDNEHPSFYADAQVFRPRRVGRDTRAQP